MVRTVIIFTLLSLFSVIGYTQEQVIVPPDFELSSPDEEPHGAFGEAVAGIRDINNDGYPDIVTGAPLETPESGPDGAGCVYVWCGKTGDCTAHEDVRAPALRLSKTRRCPPGCGPLCAREICVLTADTYIETRFRGKRTEGTGS